jgi:hypothetical protein
MASKIKSSSDSLVGEKRRKHTFEAKLDMLKRPDDEESLRDITL